MSENYCILITITRDSISFRYNRTDGDNRFADFAPGSKGVEMPFAILCSAGQFVIGKAALESARANHNPNAYTDLFNTCKAKRTFRYANRDESLGKLPYFAIRYYIEQILSQEFYNLFGSLESNVARMPLIFLFGPELDTNQQRLILAPFEEGGFQNLWSINYPQLLLPVVNAQTIPADRQRTKATALVTPEGEDLLIQLYTATGDKLLGDTIRIVGKGKDPRLQQATDSIWKVLYNYNYKSREAEEDILRDAAERFLNSGESTINDTLRMSDGSEQCYYIDRSMLDNSMMAQVNRDIMYHLNNELRRLGLTSQDCRVVLTGKAATDYFEGVFNQSRWALPVMRVTEKEKQQILSNLLEQIKKKNYYWGTPIPGPTPPPDPPIRWIRRVKITKHEIEAQIAKGNVQAAHDKLNGLLTELYNARITYFDAELKKLANRIASEPASTSNSGKQPTRNGNVENKEQRPDISNGTSPVQPPQVPPSTPTNPEPAPKPKPELTQREVRTRLAPLRETMEANYNKAFKEFCYLKEQAQRINSNSLNDNIAEFEKLFKEAKERASTSRKQASAHDNQGKQSTLTTRSASSDSKQGRRNGEKNATATGSTGKVLSTADKLFKQGNFREAKAAYAKEGNSTMAGLCTKLVKGHGRIERAIRPELQSVVDAHNKDKARKYIEELQEMKRLIEQAKLDADTSAITALIQAYRKA